MSIDLSTYKDKKQKKDLNVEFKLPEFSKKLSDKRKEIFYRELGMLLKSGSLFISEIKFKGFKLEPAKFISINATGLFLIKDKTSVTLGMAFMTNSEFCKRFSILEEKNKSSSIRTIRFFIFF